jgi:hypothetical protein
MHHTSVIGNNLAAEAINAIAPIFFFLKKKIMILSLLVSDKVNIYLNYIN